MIVPDVAFDLRLEHGRCLGVYLPKAQGAIEALAESALLPGERDVARGMAAARKRGWVGGRVAMRQALAREGIDAPPVLADGRGAPMLPPGVAGSISHKEALAVALVAQEGTARIGVDVEFDAPRTIDIASKVLTDAEARELVALDARARAREVLLRFSAKEAVYKALDPFVKRYVGFQEVAVSPRPDGGAAVEPRLCAGEGPFDIDVRWHRFEGLILTTARVART